MIPHVPCECGLAMLPGAELEGVNRLWHCHCGKERWHSDQTPRAPVPPAPEPPVAPSAPPAQGGLFG